MAETRAGLFRPPVQPVRAGPSLRCSARDLHPALSQLENYMVRAEGLEPPRVTPTGPKPAASANFATPAGGMNIARQTPPAKGEKHPI